tara:strand:+ start:245 stop:802 length:558 start_codon:yes stop_codon:yes gene_type:complete
MSFNFVKGKPSFPIGGLPIMSGNFIGDIDGDGSDLENVSHIAQTNAAEGRLVFFDSSTTGLSGNERNIRGHNSLSFNRTTNVFTVGSGLVFGRREISTHYSIQVSDYYIGSNHTASITLTLPYASTLASGQTFTIKDESGQANSFNITVVRQGSDTIDGETNFVIESPYGAVNLYSNGTDKFFLF